mgnify:CR=1 FL=1|tara:strand:+ start:825 stop:1745 length:921 start_codon:yes stop_codon:yes gene_type:complete
MSNKLYWHKQQEVVLKKWAETASSYRYLHDRSFQKYTSQNMWFAIPVIILSTITGTANFAQASFPDSAKEIAPAIIGSLNLAAGLITTIAQFLRVSELLEGHRVASVAYGKFSRNITVELSLPIEERTIGGTEFLNNCRSELDKLIEQSPNIPMNILKKFEKKFKDKEFMRPDILEISSVEIYVPDEEEQRKEREKIFKEEQEKRKKIIEEEKSTIEKVMSEAALRKQAAKEVIKIENKKHRMSATSVFGDMDKLLGLLKPGETTETIEEKDDSDTSSDNGTTFDNGITFENNVELIEGGKKEDED